MSPGEIRACYRLYAAHRKSHEICAFPETILANDVGTPAELAALRLHTGLEGLAREVGHCDPNDDFTVPGRRRAFRLFAKDARIVRCPVVRSRRSD